MNRLSRHIQHYIPLFAIFAVALYGFILIPYDSYFQMAVTVATACGYISWGIVHHYIHGDLKPYIVLEYASIALVGVVIIFSMLFV